MRDCVALVAVIALVVTAGCAEIYETDDETDGLAGQRDPLDRGAPGPGSESGVQSPETSDGAPPDPPSDRLGWEAGYWYNESIDVTPSDGYNRSELERILSRSMARVERIRGLEFDERPDLKLVDRDRYVSYVEGRFDRFLAGGVSPGIRLRQNTKFEALFAVGEDTSYYRDLRDNRGSFAGAFYATRRTPGLENVSVGDIVVIVSGGETASVFSETTLGHELMHRLQDTNLRVLNRLGGPTEEARNLNRGLVEGSATYVGRTYAERCDEEWDCLATSGGTASISEFANPGLVVYSLGLYGETATLFDRLHQRGGNEALDRLWEDPPVSTEQLLHPERYPDDVPTEVTYEDRSSEEWQLQTRRNRVDYVSFGEMGIFAMLYNPSLRSNSTVVMDPGYVFDDTNETYVRFDYTHPASEGWDGDKLFVYVNENSAATNETGFVWKTVWDSAEDAEEFAGAYTTILEFYGGAVEGRASTYRIADGEPFEDAFYVDVSGDTVTIVNAPTVADLAELRPDSARGVTEAPALVPGTPARSGAIASV